LPHSSERQITRFRRGYGLVTQRSPNYASALLPDFQAAFPNRLSAKTFTPFFRVSLFIHTFVHGNNKKRFFETGIKRKYINFVP